MKLTSLDRFIQATAREAGEGIKASYGVITSGTAKTGPNDIVTQADITAEGVIISAIRKKFPYHNILSEEAGSLPGKSEYTWIIDPLDGTNNFAHQVPIFCVIIALAKGNTVTHGVMYDPLHDEMFYARKGAGAYRNGKPIHVTNKADLDDMNIIVSNVRWRSALEQFAHWRSLISLYTTHQKQYGSAGMSLAYVASGRVDGYMIGGAYPWDLAAGALLIQEAGGKVTTLQGTTWSWRDNNQQVLAANPQLHKRILQLMHPQ